MITEPVKPVRARLPRARRGHGRRRRRGSPGARRGRRARLPAAVARDDARRLGRRRALPRHVLAALPRHLDARRLGLDRRGRLLVPARPQRRHAQHRRQADRAGGARVGGDRAAAIVAEAAAVGVPHDGEGRGGVDLLRAEPGDERGRGARRRRRRRTRSARRSSPTGSCGSRRCRRRARPRSCAAPCVRVRSARTRATCRRSRTPRRWRRSRMPFAELRGTALVTGGGRGIGANIARELASAGMDVIVTARSRGEIDAVAGEIGGRALAVDVSRARRRSSARSARPARSTCSSRNAGIGNRPASTWEIDPDAWWRAFEVNVLGVYLCCRAVIPGMLERGGGRIVNVAQRLGVPPGRDRRQRVRREQGGRAPLRRGARRRARADAASSSSRSAPGSSGRR